MTYEELQAENARLKADNKWLERRNTTLFTQFAGCSVWIKHLRLEIGYLQSEKAELQDQLEQLTRQQAA